LATATTYEVDGRTVEITHPDRVLFPADGFTKADVAAYHHAVAPVLVRHLADRPLMLQRFPGGIGKDGFYQKDAGKTLPRWIRTVRARKEGGSVNHPVVDDEAALLALSNLGTVSWHRWGARADELERPDVLIVDLDPSRDDMAAVVQAAHWTRELLDELDLPAYVQLTGSRGLHVVTPLDRAATTEEVGAFADGLAVVLAARHPDELTHEFSKAARGDRIYLDTARNGYAQTAVSPYSIRPRDGAPVATPVEWDELDAADVRADRWTITSLPGRLAERGDPWADMARHARSLPSRTERLVRLVRAAG
jgi:bifunctional non-homologous end joining protein LigD